MGNIDIPFKLEDRQSFSVECPKCSSTRGKKTSRSLMVYRDEDKKIRFQCHHAGQCEWNKMQTIDDPEPLDKDKRVEPTTTMPVPSYEPIPSDYRGDKLYWYRDIDGNYLFANRRINLGDGQKVYVPFVYTEQGFITGKDAKWPANYKGLYGAETIKGKKKAIIVEGEKAADAAKELFPEHAVVSWQGGANSIGKADWDLLKDIEAVLLWPDNDDAGKKVMRQIAPLLPTPRILLAHVDHLPHKADLADGLSKEDIQLAVSKATGMTIKIPGVWSLDQIQEQMTDLATYRRTGFDIVDAHVKLPGSGLLVIEGRTKHGKSAAAVAITASMLLKDLERTVIFYSYEMTAAKVFLRYMKSINPNISAENFRGSNEMGQIGELINSGRLQIVDQSAQLTIADIVVAASKPQVRGGIIVLDYLQIVPMATGFGKANRQLMIKEMLDELRVAAHKNNVLVMVLSQLTPDYDDPRRDSPREARDIHYSADLVLRVWNKGVGEFNPTYDKMGGDYFLQVYLNRDGESNIRFEGTLLEGSRLTIKRRIKE